MRSKPAPGPLGLALIFTIGAIWMMARLWSGTGSLAINLTILLLGLSLGPCVAAYVLVARKRKQSLRRLILITGGLSILTYSFTASANLDLEGFFQLVLEGVGGAAVGHTVITLVLGPVVGGRFLCGWGCWRAMVLELLPVGHGTGRRGGVWRVLPWAGLAVTFAAAAIGLFVFGHHAGGVPGSRERAGTLAIAGGVAVYYVAAVGLAVVLKDQRAFCKYLCPSAAILRLTSRLALVKMTPDPALCNGCGACSRVCPMDIDVMAFAARGERVGTGQCILCQRCAHACPRDALGLTVRRQ